MSHERMKVGITCHPSIGGSGILACALGEQLARRGHAVHFMSYERPVRLPADTPGVFFHPVRVSDYELFKYPDYTLPLSVKMAEVSSECGLDILHAHYAVPHATAAILASSMLPPAQRPRVVTTLHGTDTTLLGRDPGYAPAIRHALVQSDAVTAVSQFLRQETERLFVMERPIQTIYNFSETRTPARSRAEVRAELGLASGQAMIVHHSNLRPSKRIDLLLETAARIRPSGDFKLVILAGGDFTPFAADLRRLGLEDRVMVLERVTLIEDYLQAADLALFTSEVESFCLGVLEAMQLACPCVSTAVGGIPEVMGEYEAGILVPFGDPDALARAVEALLRDPARRRALGETARRRARERFSADLIVPQYEALYRRVLSQSH